MGYGHCLLLLVLARRQKTPRQGLPTEVTFLAIGAQIALE